MARAAAGAAMRLVRTHLPSVDSTNTHAKSLIAARALDAAAVTMVTADEQTAGRGRGARSWASTRGDVKATFAVRLPSAVPRDRAYLLSPLLALSAVRVLRRVAGGAGLRFGIKWPNDVVATATAAAPPTHKVAGILAELAADPDSPAAAPVMWGVLGIGINVNSSAAELGVARPVWPVGTLASLHGGGGVFDVDAVYGALGDEMARALPAFFAEGFAPFLLDFEAANVLIGRTIRFDDGGKAMTGVATGIDAGGFLRLRLPGGEETSLVSGEVTGVTVVDDASGAAIEVAGSPDAEATGYPRADGAGAR